MNSEQGWQFDFIRDLFYSIRWHARSLSISRIIREGNLLNFLCACFDQKSLNHLNGAGLNKRFSDDMRFFFAWQSTTPFWRTPPRLQHCAGESIHQHLGSAVSDISFLWKRTSIYVKAELNCKISFLTQGHYYRLIFVSCDKNFLFDVTFDKHAHILEKMLPPVRYKLLKWVTSQI